jgi:exonuclease SbcC
VYFERLRLEQFKPYASVEVALGPGVTVIHGLNGSGKSSLLEACFLSLYGSRALDDTLDAVMTTGADATVVELQLRHQDASLTIHRELRRRSSGAATTSASLEGPRREIEGTRDIRAHVRELLRMDVDAFRNCAYVRQGEINKLIEATPAERQRMIDTLLQLGRLETYRDRARSAALAVDDAITGITGRIDELEAQITPLAAAEPDVAVRRLDAEIAETEERIGYYTDQQERAEEVAADARTTIAEYEADVDEHAAVTEAVAAAEDAIRKLQHRHEQLDTTRSEQDEALTTAVSERDAALAALGEPDPTGLQRHHGWVERAAAIAEAAREEALQQHSTATAEQTQVATESRRLHSRSQELAARIERLRTERDSQNETLAAHRSEYQVHIAQRQVIRQLIASAPTPATEWPSHHDRLQQEHSTYERIHAGLEAELTEAEADVDEVRRLIADGRCPTCGQPTDTIHAHATRGKLQQRTEIIRGELRCVTTRLTRIADRMRTAATVIALSDALAAVERECAHVHAQLEEDARRLETQQQELEAAEAAERALAEERAALGARRPEVSAALQRAAVALARSEQLRTGVASHAEMVEAAAAAETARVQAHDRLAATTEKLELVGEQLTEKRQQLRDLRADAQSLAEQLDTTTIETARERLGDAEEYLAQVHTQLSILQGERDQLTERRGELAGMRDRLRTLRAERDRRVDSRDELTDVADEVRELEALYETLRGDLRSRHLQVLERLLNEMFQLVYGNDAYAGIDLDPTYAITVRQNDGTPLSPTQLSGGERAVFNLALRCAIYQLLAEGATGSTDLPPLILDEPTVFLDRGHVRQLSALIDAMREIGVPQVLIVTHDEELIGAADRVIRVEKDPHSNRSVIAATAHPGSSTGA